MRIFFLQLRNELWKLFAKKRTYIGLGMFLIAQNAIILLFRFTPAMNSLKRMLEGNGFIVTDYMSALTLSTMMVVVMAFTLLPLYVALMGGDFVAKEAEDGTLRMILARPISRLRLILLKWLAGGVFSAVMVIALGLFGFLFSALWFPVSGGLFVFLPGEIFAVHDFAAGLGHYAAAHLIMLAKAQTILTLGLMFSCFNMKPAAATVLALSIVLITRILMEIPYFQDMKHWFLAYHLDSWKLVLLQQIPWSRLAESLSILGAVNVSLLVIGCTAFHLRDIKS
jgi:ABC-2 type transport system permease protein